MGLGFFQRTGEREGQGIWLTARAREWFKQRTTESKLVENEINLNKQFKYISLDDNQKTFMLSFFKIINNFLDTCRFFTETFPDHLPNRDWCAHFFSSLLCFIFLQRLSTTYYYNLIFLSSPLDYKLHERFCFFTIISQVPRLMQFTCNTRSINTE